MERLHTSILNLLRYGGLHPVKTTNNLNTALCSKWLVLWTAALQLVNVISVVHILIILARFSSLDMFLVVVWNAAYCLITIIIPTSFFCNNKNIATFYRKIDKILINRSINRLQINIRSKLMIFIFVLGKIVYIIGISLDVSIACGSTHLHKILKGHLSVIFVTFHGFFIVSLCYIIFITYMIILEEYFTLCQVNLEELFNGTPSSIRQNSLALPEQSDDALTNSDENLTSVHSIDLTPSYNFKPYKLFIKTMHIPTNSAFPETSVSIERIDPFVQHLQLIHASVLEVYNIYELLMSFLGFPLLYLTFYCTSTICISSYSIWVIISSDKVDICSAVNLFIHISISVMDLVILTTFPHILDEKAST